MIELILTHVEKNECWEWKGPKNHGRPRIRFKGKWYNTRKIIFEAEKNQPARGRAATTCGNRMCVNPDHIIYGALEERFRQQVVIGETNKCWLWTGPRNKQGYGELCANGIKILAHRYSYTREHGELRSGYHVLHTCDNPPCVNPNHLWVGTHQDNMRDMVMKGRSRHGENHSRSKLSDDQVREMRSMFSTGDYSKTEIGEIFGVSQSQAFKIITRQQWNHVR